MQEGLKVKALLINWNDDDGRRGRGDGN